jgi:protein SCO1
MSRVGRAAGAVALSVVVGCLTACAGPAGPGSTAPGNPAGVRISGVSQRTAYGGVALPEPYRMPDLTLTADNGQPFNLVTDTAYPVTLVFFGYTHCPDECPLVMSDLAAAYLRLPLAVRKQTQVLFVTTDPARDTDRALRSYLARYNPSFVGLRGPLRTIMTAARAMGVAITGVERLPSGGYDVGHSTQVIGFRGNLAPVIWTVGTPVDDVVKGVVQLAGR